MHPSGEVVSWHEEGEPSEVTYEKLKRAVAKVASCVLLSRHYPAQGGRQFAAMALAGWLLRNGWGREETSEFILALAGLAGDAEAKMRVTQIKNTESKVEGDLPATGFPRLLEYYPQEVLEKVAEWLALKTEKEKHPQLVVVDKFYPRPFTEALCNRFKFWWPGGREPLLWFCEPEGIWKENGEDLVAHELRTALESLPDAQKRRYVIDEIVADVKGVCWNGKPLPPPDLDLVPCANGVFDLKTKQLRPFRANDFFTWKLPWKYDTQTKSKLVVPLVESFLPEGETVTLYELMAYCLYRDYCYPKVFFLFGRGSNGKSVFAKILEGLLGKENISHITLDGIQKERFAGSGLYGKLANICGELEYVEIQKTGLLKQLCGGDTITADRKYREPINFRNYAKLIFLTNEVPQSCDTTEAFYRRLFLIEFPKKFEENPQLEVEVGQAGEDEYSALLAKVVGALITLKEQNFIFTHHKSLEETRELYLQLSSPLNVFVKENCEVSYSNDDYIYKFEFKERFQSWLKEKGRTAYSDSRFKRELLALGVSEGLKGEKRWSAWVGIRWTEQSLERGEREERKESTFTTDYTTQKNCLKTPLFPLFSLGSPNNTLPHSTTDWEEGDI